MNGDIPKEIFDAANKIDCFFKMRGIQKWELLSIQSRNFDRLDYTMTSVGETCVCKSIKCGYCGKFIADKDLSKSHYHFTPDSACASEELYYTCSGCKD